MVLNWFNSENENQRNDIFEEDKMGDDVIMENNGDNLFVLDN